MLVVGIVASVLLAIGLLPPYFEIWKRRGRVYGINFFFLSMDSAGALLSMISIIVGTMDIMIWYLAGGRQVIKKEKAERKEAKNFKELDLVKVDSDENTTYDQAEKEETSPNHLRRPTDHSLDMSSFAPLNLNEDSSFSKKDLEEEYTRELAIEQAFKSFEEALKLQDSGSLKSAYFTYKELFKLEVISNHYFEERDFIKGIQNGGSNNIADELSFLSPNVKTLRYLVFRNRGFLYYEILKSGQDFINEIYLDEKNKKSEIARKSNDEEVSDMEEVTLKDFFKQLFYVMIDDFIICLIYQDADEKLLNTIYDIFIYLDIKKLIRFTLEYTLSGKSESDDILGLLPINSKALKKYHHLLSRLNDSSTPFDKSYLDKELNFVNKRLFFLKPIKDEFLEQIENIKKNNVVEIPIRGALNWGSIIDDINDFLKKNQDKEKLHDFSKAKIKDLDPYYLTESSIEKITFKIPEIKSLDENDEFFDAQEENNELKKEDPIEEPENKVEIIVDADEDRKNPNKPQVQRSSKRLARNDSITDEIQIIELTKDSFFNTNTFLKELNEYLNLLDDKEEHLKVGDITEIYLNNDRLDDELEEVRKNAQESFANS
ncbi:hypothetical protein QCA50_017248 [Cerrena zonata]|uniref:TerB-C domain-containing protein n=1 Tax=Cerrena zonata TaxID=2478898 RepID=A0AAW0FGN8_9APHY